MSQRTAPDTAAASAAVLAPPARTSAAASRARTLRRLLPLVSILLMFGVWILLSASLGDTAGTHPARLMPAPWDVAKDFTGISVFLGPGTQSNVGNALHVLADATWTSARRLVLGLLIGGTLGIGIGLLFGWSARVRAFAEGPLLLVRTIPLLALIPLFLTWFGGTDLGIVTFIAFATFSMLLINTIEAIRNVSPVTQAYARTLGASELRVYRTVIVPAIVPELVGGIRVVIGVSWAILLAGEFLGAQSGIGHILILAEQYTYTSRMLLIVLLIMAYTFLLDRGFARMSRSLTRWVPR